MPTTKPSSLIAPRRLFAALSVLAALSFTACRATTTPPPDAPPAAVPENTWAVVDGRQITRDDVEKAYRRTRDTSQAASDEDTLATKLTLLNDLILQDVLIAKARELKVEVPDSEVESSFAEARKNITDEAFQQELTKRGVTAADMREGLRREMLTQKLVDQEVSKKVTVTSQEVSDFFLANRSQFNLAEEGYHIAQIVVTPAREPQVANRTGDDAATPEAAGAKVKMLMERLKAGTPFTELAMDYSEDPESASRGGDLGLVPVSRLKQAPPQLQNAVLKKAPGTVSVASAGGAHTLVLVISHEEAGQRDLSTPGVNDRITEALRARREQLLRAAFLTSAREEARVVNHLARRLVESQGKVPAALATASAKP